MLQGKKVLAIVQSILVVTAVLGSFVPIAYAQPTATSFGVEDAEGYPDTHLLIPVNITNVQNGPVPTIIFNILYNNSVINVTDIQKGTLTSNWDNPDYCNHDWGTSVVIYTSTDAYAVQNDSSGSVALLNFSVIDEVGATSVMDLSNIQLADLNFQVGTAPVNNGTFTVLHDDLNVVSCLGDSVTNGYPYAGTENTYPARLQAMLNAAYGSGSYEVVNHGCDGHTADQVLADLQNLNWLAQDNPDIVLLMVGGNDLAQEATPLNLFDVINQTVAEVQDIVDLVTAHTNPDGSHPQIIVSAFTPVHDTLESTAVKLYNNRLESDLTGMDLWITDNWDDFYDTGTGHARASLLADNVHPNADGYAIMAENWFVACDSIMDVIYVSPESYIVRSFTDKEGRQIDEIIVPGRPPVIKAPTVTVPESDIAKGINVLSNVPAFNWCYGCSATAAAMMLGYYDNAGYPNMYAGPANGGVCPLTNSVWGYEECPLSATHQGKDGLATRGHVDNYWYSYGSNNDPYYGNWAEHGYADCTADYMGTNQYHNWQASDGGTWFYFYDNGAPLYDYAACEEGTPPMRDGCHGMRLFADSRGYNMFHDGYNYQNYNQYIYGYNGNTQGFTFAQFQAEIDAGRPMIIQVAGHSMLGYGYDTAGNIVYIHDTWDHGDHQMTWGGSYSGMQHYGVTVIQLEPLESSSWTFMVYLGADNNLEEAGIDDFLEMSSVGTTSNVNISVQFDRIPGYDNRYDDWTGCKRFLVTPGMTPTIANAIADLGECNMGDPDTLKEFVNWTMTNYPADNYALILWNHGSGWKKGVPWGDFTGSGRGVCWDYTNNSDYLTLQETEQALTGEYVDLLGYDACVMHMVEVVYQVLTNAGISVGSEENEPWDGWPYDTILGDLTGTPVMTPRSLGSTIVQRYIDLYGSAGSETQSAVDNADLPGLVTALDNLAQTLITEINAGNLAQAQQARTATAEIGSDYIDLYHFAQQVQTYVPGAVTEAQAVMAAVGTAVYAEAHGSTVLNDHGLSIYFPVSEGDYLSSYGNTKFANDTNWDEFLNRYYKNIDVNKTVRDPKTGNWEKGILANVSDELRFKIWVHNNCTANLTNITVNDTLSAGLEYLDGTATPSEPDTKVQNEDGSTTLYWYFSSTLEYCENVTIEFNASKKEAGKDRNCVNVSGWYNETEPQVQVFDDDYTVVRGQRDDVVVFLDGAWYVDTDLNQENDLIFTYGCAGCIPVVGDINQDGIDDVAVFLDGTWYVDTNGDQKTDRTFTYGCAGCIPVVGDINQDGIDDVAVFLDGNWYVDTNLDQENDLIFTYGCAGCIPVVGDINQDGREDVAVFLDGTWYVDTNLDQENDLIFTYGCAGCIPVVGDINQDGIDDVAVFLDGTWYVDTDLNQETDRTFTYGSAGCIPVVGAITKPGIEVIKTVFDTKKGVWVDEIKANVTDELQFRIWIYNNGTCSLANISVNDTQSASLEYVADYATVNGEACEPEVVSGQQLLWYYNVSKPCTDPFKSISVGQSITIEFNATKNRTGDDTNCVNVSAWSNETEPHVQIFDDDCAGVYGWIDDVAVFLDGIWYVDTDRNYGTSEMIFTYGCAGCIPVVGDIDGDGADEVAVFLDGTWYVDTDGNFKTSEMIFTYGCAGCIPVVGDIDGDGTDDVAVFLDGAWYVDTDGNYETNEMTFKYGCAGCIPVVGDITQDGIDDVAVFLDGNWYVDTDGNYETNEMTFKYGCTGCYPVVGDINQDGLDEVAVFLDGNWYVDTDGNYETNEITFKYGCTGCIPVVGSIN